MVWLATTRNGRQWIIPKGNVDSGRRPQDAAAQEAFEEAGLVGTIGQECIGTFVHHKQKPEGAILTEVDVYRLNVSRQLSDWPEKDEREILRCSVSSALTLISIPSLAQLIRSHFAVRGHAAKNGMTHDV